MLNMAVKLSLYLITTVIRNVICIMFCIGMGHIPVHSKLLLEKGYIAINEKFDKLITSLRTAVAVENTLDKEAVNFATEHKPMLAHLHMLINKEYLAIPRV